MLSNNNQNQKILITGAGGHFGRDFLPRLLKSGKNLRVLMLPDEKLNFDISPWKNQVEIWYGDIRDAKSLIGIAQEINLTIHLAGLILTQKPSRLFEVNTKGMFNLIAELNKSEIKSQVIYTSSISVEYPQLTQYGKSKIEAENLLIKSGLDYLIIRPTLLVSYQGGQEWELFKKWVEFWPIVPMINKGRALKKPILMEEFSEFLLQLIKNEFPENQIIYACSKESISLFGMAELIKKNQHKKLFILNIPLLLIKPIIDITDYLCLNQFSLRQALAGWLYEAAPRPSLLCEKMNWKCSSPKKIFSEILENNK